MISEFGFTKKLNCFYPLHRNSAQGICHCQRNFPDAVVLVAALRPLDKACRQSDIKKAIAAWVV